MLRRWRSVFCEMCWRTVGHDCRCPYADPVPDNYDDGDEKEAAPLPREQPHANKTTPILPVDRLDVKPVGDGDIDE